MNPEPGSIRIMDSDSMAITQDVHPDSLRAAHRWTIVFPTRQGYLDTGTTYLTTGMAQDDAVQRFMKRRPIVVRFKPRDPETGRLYESETF